MMREYETVYIADPSLSDPKLNEFNERLKGIISRSLGRLFFARQLGKMALAYPIQKQIKGTYMCLDYAGAGSVVAEIERVLRFDESILRFLTIVKREDIDIEARAAEIVARGEDRAPEPEEAAAAVQGDGDGRDMREGL